MTKPASRALPEPKLTDAERHARFVQTAREVGVDESPEGLDRAFEKVMKPGSQKNHRRQE